MAKILFIFISPLENTKTHNQEEPLNIMRKKRVMIFVNDAILMKDQSFRVCTAIGRVTDGISKKLVGRSLQICSAKSAPLIGIGLTYLIKFGGD